jgi:Ras-related protein Rab-28
LGDGAVGKTSIATRFCQDHFSKPYKQTIGLDLFLKRLQLPTGPRATLQVWDIGGQTIGGNMVGNYIYGAHAVLFCYDVTNYNSFQNLEDWLRLVKRTFKNAKTRLPAMWLCANKGMYVASAPSR